MASTNLTAYERKRLDNIHRNEQMLASLKSMASQLTASTKRRSDKAKPRTAPISKSGSETTPIVVRRSLRNRGMPPTTEGLDDGFISESPAKKPKTPTVPLNLGPLTVEEAYQGEVSHRLLLEKILEMAKDSENVRIPDNLAGGKFGGSYDVSSMTLKPYNIVHLVSDRVMVVRFFPCGNSKIIAAGNKHGDIGFWNLGHEINEEGNNIYNYHSHSGPISGISIHPQCLSKVFSSCYNGTIRVMDAEKEVFDLIESSENTIYSLSHRSNDAKCLFFSEGSGGLKIWDERDGKCSSHKILHAMRINSIDFNSRNPNLMATSSSDGTACIWDLRSIDANKPKNLYTVEHKRSIHSAYFSPSGNVLATTSFDDTVGILGGKNFEDSSRIQHNNQTGRWIAPFKAIWGWDDSYIFIGNMKRGVDVVSPAHGRTISTLQSSDMTAIPCRFDIHPYHIGMLAGGTGGGRVYVWTMS